MFLFKLEHLNPDNAIDVDGAKSSAKHLSAKRGWAPVGETACKFTFHICGKHLTTMCAFTPRGFTNWTVYEGNLNNRHIIDFFRTELSPSLTADSYVILDNWSGHHHPDAIRAIDEVTNGRWKFAAQYAYNTKPVERGISMVKAWVRNYDAAAAIDPISVLNAAFYYYSPQGPGGVVAHGLWRQYYDNHNAYLHARNV